MTTHQTIAAALVALASAAAQAQLPPPPMSSAPVVNYEYDAQGNPTRMIQAPGVPGLDLKTVNTYDALGRIKDSTDPKLGKTQISYDGLDRPVKVTDPRSLVTQYPRNGLGKATKVISPDTGTATQTYDAAGNLKTRTDNRGVKTTYTYDALNRPTKAVYSQSGQANHVQTKTYDEPDVYGLGRLTSTAHPGGATSYAYSPQGDLLTDTQAIKPAAGANPKLVKATVTYGYDAAGSLTSIVYPSGRKLNITRTNGEVSSLSLASNAQGGSSTPLIDQIQYTAFGAVQSWQWAGSGGPVLNDKAYDLYGRLIRYRLGPVVRDIAYDAADRITSYTHYNATTAAPQTALDQSFSYDENSRLTLVTTSSGTLTFSYDANGNRSSATVSGNARSYATAPDSNRLSSLTNPVRNFNYDSAGNLTTDSEGYSAAYDLPGRLATLTKGAVTTRYTYDGFGRRVRKVNSTGAGSTVLFVYGRGGKLLGEYDQNGAALREYVWLGATPIAVFTPDPAAAKPAKSAPLVYFIHTDHIDTPRLVTDKAYNARWRWMADPFGTSAPETNPAGLGAFTFNLRFPGQYADAESGLNYNYFRNYDASLGRYTQSDPIGLDGGINTYAYVDGRPLSEIDPYGLKSWWDQLKDLKDFYDAIDDFKKDSKEAYDKGYQAGVAHETAVCKKAQEREKSYRGGQSKEVTRGAGVAHDIAIWFGETLSSLLEFPPTEQRGITAVPWMKGWWDGRSSVDCGKVCPPEPSSPTDVSPWNL